MLACAWGVFASVALLPAQTNPPVAPASGTDTNECKTPTSRVSLFKQLGASPFTAKSADASFAYYISPKSHWQVKATKVLAKTAAASFFQVQLEVSDTLAKQSHDFVLSEPFTGTVEISVQPDFVLVLGTTRDGYRATVVNLTSSPKSGVALPIGLPDVTRKLSNVYWAADRQAWFVVEQGSSHSHTLVSLQMDAASSSFKPAAAQLIAWQPRLKTGVIPQEGGQKIAYEISASDPTTNALRLTLKPAELFQTNQMFLTLPPPVTRASQ